VTLNADAKFTIAFTNNVDMYIDDDHAACKSHCCTIVCVQSLSV